MSRYYGNERQQAWSHLPVAIGSCRRYSSVCAVDFCFVINFHLRHDDHFHCFIGMAICILTQNRIGSIGAVFEPHERVSGRCHVLLEECRKHVTFSKNFLFSSHLLSQCRSPFLIMSANYTGSILNLEYTRSFSKISCHRDFYFIHVVCCYFVFLSGIVCFITRAWCRFKWLHASFGRIYIISMLWATASSLLINNTGLPDAVLISFAYTMAG